MIRAKKIRKIMMTFLRENRFNLLFRIIPAFYISIKIIIVKVFNE